MPRYIEKLEKIKVPVVALRGVVAYPSIPLSFEISNQNTVSVCEKVNHEDGLILLVLQKDIALEKPSQMSDFYEVGTVSKIKQFVKLPEGNARIITDGVCRATLLNCEAQNGIFYADVMCKTVNVDSDGGVKGEALMGEAMTVFDEFVSHMPKISQELMFAIKSIKSPGLLADLIAGNVLIRYEDKQRILAEFDPLRRIELLAVIMENELEIIKAESSIHRRVRAQIESNQREYYLREQLKVIQNELGYGGDAESETDEYFDKIAKAQLPPQVEEKLVKEVKKLAKSPYNSAESGVIRNYLDVCLELPWSKTTKDRVDIAAAQKILDRDHDGLEKVKDRILEFIAVKQLNPDIKNQILCLVGPPGTGKTSIGQSIAAAMKRKYVRVSLGGVRDEADIRGHRKTYIGSMPGRIVTAINQAGVRNPLILLDEIDKLSRDAHGDPASALLEVLDSEQNKAFRDHFLELPLDLSECLFIATANTLETIPRPLIDRMEIIELKIYTRNEKLSIAKNHLLPKQLKRHGLSRRTLKISDDAILEIIEGYTHEAGVRNLEREIGALCRKAAREMIAAGTKSCNVTAETVAKYLGIRKILPDTIPDQNEIGVVNGLAYTEVGGDLLKIEIAAMPGTGKLELTGSLGDVMKESAHAAVTYVRSHYDTFGIDSEFYKKMDIHIHVPEGAVPKDGPSAGVAIMTALVSELSKTPIRRDIAMTGEITLRGNVLAIGGLKEKTMAAYKAGVKTVLIPKANERDIPELDPVVRQALEIIGCKYAAEVLEHALIKPQKALYKNISDICHDGNQTDCMPQKTDIIAIIPDTLPIRNSDLGMSN